MESCLSDSEPFLDVNEKSAAIADKGGNDIIVFQEDGLKGEIHTTLPIEKINVSEQGIVGAILKMTHQPKLCAMIPQEMFLWSTRRP